MTTKATQIKHDEIAEDFDKILKSSDKKLPDAKQAKDLLDEIANLENTDLQNKFCIRRYGLDKETLEKIVENESNSMVEQTNDSTIEQVDSSTVEPINTYYVEQPTGSSDEQPTCSTPEQFNVQPSESSGDNSSNIHEQIHVKMRPKYEILQLIKTPQQQKFLLYIYTHFQRYPEGTRLVFSVKEVALDLDMSFSTTRNIIKNFREKGIISTYKQTKQQRCGKQGTIVQATALGVQLYKICSEQSKTTLNLSSQHIAKEQGTCSTGKQPYSSTIKHVHGSDPIQPLNTLTTKQATCSPLSSGSNFFNNTTTDCKTPEEEVFIPKTQISEFVELLDLTDWPTLEPNMLINYIERGIEWSQDILDATYAVIKNREELKISGNEKITLIQHPFKFLESNLAKGWVDTPPDFLTRKQKAIQAKIAQEQKNLELIMELKRAREQREDLEFEKSFEEMLIDPEGELYKEIFNEVPESSKKIWAKFKYKPGHPAVNNELKKQLRIYLGLAVDG